MEDRLVSKSDIDDGDGETARINRRNDRIFMFYQLQEDKKLKANKSASKNGNYVSTRIVSKSRDGRDFFEWRGIPFGKAPIGPLRFASPIPFGKWEGVRDGSKFGGRCPEICGSGRNLGDEDCLNLNVSVPMVNHNRLMPVMVFIHGGGFQEGTGNLYTPQYFMDEDVVYVNPNYRLGVLGFLNTGDTAIREVQGPLPTTRPDLDCPVFVPSIEVVNDEEAFLVEHPLQIMAEGRAHRVPILIGANADEGLLSAMAMYHSDEIVENYEKNWDNCIRWTFGIPEDTPNATDLAARTKEIYFPQNSNFTKDQKLKQFTKMFSDAYFWLHISHCISVQSQFSPVYSYYFSRMGGPSITKFHNLLTSADSMFVKIAKHVAASIYNKITRNKPRNYGISSYSFVFYS
ncbi:unnamed protein product [Allacma fusca]|uniref:Carboxylesterase type B domain-containing protein n=1 Tax=Allacma fusca TaxID=39272 RepID=A0A8J2JNS5_9HEXA|nr:unnamed protein product [Allacma fusca]